MYRLPTKLCVCLCACMISGCAWPVLTPPPMAPYYARQLATPSQYHPPAPGVTEKDPGYLVIVVPKGGLTSGWHKAVEEAVTEGSK